MQWQKLIESIEPSHATVDQIDGLKLMLLQESFQEVYPFIQKKLDEIEALRKTDTFIQSGFKLEIGKFYITENNSVVFSLKKENILSAEAFEMVVLSGGFTDPDLPAEDIVELMYGSFKVGHIYYVDNLGKANAACDEPHYAMHIMRQINRNKAFDLSIQ